MESKENLKDTWKRVKPYMDQPDEVKDLRACESYRSWVNYRSWANHQTEGEI